jgi:hypothetical protein
MLIPGEKSRLSSGKSENLEADARHVFEAQKYGSYFVTRDARLS